MQNEDKWQPSKFVKTKNNFRTTRDTSKVGIGNRIICDIQAINYYDLIQEHAAGILLDLGCGDAALYEMYKPFVEKIICTDWPKTLHYASYIDFQINLNNNFPIKDDLFDTILITDVLEHIANPDNLWKEMTRILKPGGKIILSVPFFHLLHEEPYDYFRYTEFRLKMYCEENNLTILKIYSYGGSLEIFFDFIAKHISKLKYLSIFHNLLGNTLINSFIGKKIYSLTSVKYPLGYCLVAKK